MLRSARRLSLFFFLLFVVVAGALYYPNRFAEESSSADLATVLSEPAMALELGVRTKSSGCRVRGPYPDPECTPGAVFPDATVERICVRGYSKTVRDVSQKTREWVFSTYDIAYPVPRGSYELDHFIPLALGGSNSVANLFPEAAEPRPGFREKDIVELYLHEGVCAGRVALAVAQREIVRDWLSIYEALTPAEIQNIRSRFRNWADIADGFK